MSKEEKQIQLSKDTSHCCPKPNEKLSNQISLPHKNIMSKVPLCLIASIHQYSVRHQPVQQKLKVLLSQASSSTTSAMNNNLTQQLNQSHVQSSSMSVPTSSIRPTYQVYKQLNQLRPQPTLTPFRNQQQIILTRPMIRPAPYPAPASRQMTMVSIPSYNQNSLNVRAIESTSSSLLQRVQRPLPSQVSFPPTEIIDLVDDFPSEEQPTTNQQVTYDISWLENSVANVKESLLSITMMTDQLDLIKTDLNKDFSKLNNYSDRLSYNIKIAICNLAKINQDIIEGGKRILDNHVSTVVNDVKLNHLSNTISTKLLKPALNVTRVSEESENNMVTSTTPQKTADLDQALGMSSPEEDLGEMTPALLCEAVLEVEGNKENKNNDTRQNSPVKSVAKPTKKKGMFNFNRKARKSLCYSKNVQTTIPIIDLMEDDERKPQFNESYFCKKFDIKPCKVLLQRCKVNVKNV